eukprot:scaffold260913_cov18-Prasinocladus_malaysianus.AAC.1
MPGLSRVSRIRFVASQGKPSPPILRGLAPLRGVSVGATRNYTLVFRFKGHFLNSPTSEAP